MKNKLFLSMIIGIPLLVSVLSGCSITGWSAKDIPDGSNIEKGNLVTIIQKDGIEISGQYQGVQDIPVSEYMEQYMNATAFNLRDQILPRIGENIQITTSLTEDKYWEGRFVSFDQKSLWVILNGKSRPEEFYISSLTTLSNQRGGLLHRMQFRKMFVDGDIPLRSAVVVKKGEKDIKIPLNTVESIFVPQTKKTNITINENVREMFVHNQ